MTDREYVCAGCGETFESDWTDEEAEAEMLELFGNVPLEDRETVCDDCFSVMVAIDPPRRMYPQ